MRVINVKKLQFYSLTGLSTPYFNTAKFLDYKCPNLEEKEGILTKCVQGGDSEMLGLNKI